MSVYKSRGSPFDPFTCARAVRAMPAATLNKAEEGSRRETEAQDEQGNAKTRSIKEQRGEVDCPGKTLAGAASAAPARALPGQLAQRQQSEPPLRPKVPNATNNYTRTRAREAPPWWHADLCEDIECSRSNEDKRATILTEETHKTPARPLLGRPARHGKTLAGSPGKTPAESISKATIRPAPAKTPPPSPRSC